MSTAMFLLVPVIALVLAFAVFTIRELVKARSENPEVWESDIRAFEKAARKHPPPPQAVLFVGSSSIRFWRSLKGDMQPLPVIQRGFGGSKLAALDHYAERLVDVNRPRVIVVYSGSNDITPKHAKDPQQLLESFQSFAGKAMTGLPDVHIYYIAITPSPARWQAWPLVRQTNRLIQNYCESQANLHYIDTTDLWLGPDGLPERANYLWIDRLHPSKRGYANWTRVLRPILLKHYPELAEQAEVV